MKLVSFSLYGSKPMYIRGALENARLMRSIYPGWVMALYCEDDTNTSELEKHGVLIRRMGKSKEHSGMLWRFLPAWERGVDRVIFRDCDSRLNVREAAAVAEWEASSIAAHCMHDHEHHRSLPLFGGMWGIRGGILKTGDAEMRMLMRRPVPRGGDMAYLSVVILPQIKNRLLRHSSVPVATAWNARPFPSHTPYGGFVGQQFFCEKK